MRTQVVSLGRTQSGRPGFFTSGMLVIPLSEDDWSRFQGNPWAAQVRCDRYGLTYDEALTRQPMEQFELSPWGDLLMRKEIDNDLVWMVVRRGPELIAACRAARRAAA